MKPPEVHEILARCEGAYAAATLKCYRAGLEKFRRWCLARGRAWLPAEPTTIAEFLDAEAPSVSIATVRGRLNAITFAHRIMNLPRPGDYGEVRLAFRRAARSKLARPKQSMGLTSEMVEQIISACPPTLEGMRDAALISVGYDTLCRSSEIAAIRLEHLSADYSTINIPRSKADPFGEGRVAYLSPRTRKHLRRWLSKSGLSDGYLFCRARRCRLWPGRLHPQSVGTLVKRIAKRAGLDIEAGKRVTGHSMRIGAAQDMMVAGIDSLGIMQAGGWQSFGVLARYVENASAERLHLRRWQRLGRLN